MSNYQTKGTTTSVLPRPSSYLGGFLAALPEADDPGLGTEGHVDELLVEEALSHAHAVGHLAQHQAVLAHLKELTK